MPVDYSKWDALELSDDSDFEPHPNVDKRSFIRAKQTQIHQQRAERKHRITTLKYERLVNDGLLRRIDTLLAELKSHEVEAKELSASTSEDTGKNRDAFLYQALIASAGDPDDDEAPKPPEGVHNKEQEPIRYSQMMGALVDQVKKEVDEAKSGDWYKGYVKGVEGHKKKVAGLQSDLAQELAKLEKEESRKITSESIHDGFNTSHVAKGVPVPTAATASKGKAKAPSKPTETVEVLNPSALQNRPDLTDDAAQSSGADADIDEDIGPLEDEDEKEVEATELGKQFAKIPIGDYQTCLKFISQNRAVLAEKETDGLLMLAFDAQMKGKAGFAKQCVHQALLLQYCRSLGPDGVQLFFKRITTPTHQARKLFLEDVDTTYTRIQTRTTELAAERAAEEGAGVEQIQLQAVEPGTEIHINVPAPDSADPVEQQARAIFATFPPNFQKALESGSLDKVNEVLGKMSVDEAEEVVGQLGDSGMLDMRQGVIDGTTEEGREELRRMKELELAEGPTPDPE